MYVPSDERIERFSFGTFLFSNKHERNESMYKLTSNKELRERMKNNNVTLWQIAAKIGVNETTLIKWLRLELDAEHSKRVNDALNEIIEGDK